MKEIKTIGSFIHEWDTPENQLNFNSDNPQYRYKYSEVEKMLYTYGKAIIDYISENIDADYTIVEDKRTEQISEGHIEVYVPKGQFLKFKKLIK